MREQRRVHMICNAKCHIFAQFKRKNEFGLVCPYSTWGVNTGDSLTFLPGATEIFGVTVWHVRSFQNKCTSNLRAHFHLKFWIPAFDKRAAFAKNRKRRSSKGFIRARTTRTSVYATLKITKPSPQPKSNIWVWTELRTLSCLFRLNLMVAQYGSFVDSSWL